MTQIQFVGIAPDVLLDLIDERLKKHFKEAEKHLPNKTSKYLTRQEVAKFLSVDLSTVHNLSVKGILKKYQIGGRVLYKNSEVENSIVELKR
jgi:excisionase family DNA binding protein